MPIITLLTDFGLADPFVGVMKGVILSINPRVQVVDITHQVRPQDIQEAAFLLWDSYRHFPPATVHVAVVDPGVGSQRLPIALSAQGHFFVGPDNGLFSPVLEALKEVVAIENPAYMLPRPSRTFHGRDIFAPAAAWLTRGVALQELGPLLSKEALKRLPLAKARKEGQRVVGQIVHIDRFGNCISNIPAEMLQGLRGPVVLAAGRRLRLYEHYSQAEPLGAGALINSSGLLEVFLFRGSAAEGLGLRRGQEVEVVAT
jgi:hypothetical protein